MEQKPALRYNQGKLRYGLVPAQFFKWLAEVFTKGAEKYAPNNWKNSYGTDDHDSFVEDRVESLTRHLQEYRLGEDNDTETGLPHLVHVAWNALVVSWYDRYYSEGE